MEEMKYIGKAIKEKRLSLNFRMDDLASMCGITRATLSSIENGKSNCSVSVLFKILDVLKLPFSLNENKEVSKRNRASRINTSLDKKINRFIIMCVQEYVKNVNGDSGKIYKKMLEKGVIKFLHDDYEDLHGESTTTINQYIGLLLAK